MYPSDGPHAVNHVSLVTERCVLMHWTPGTSSTLQITNTFTTSTSTITSKGSVYWKHSTSVFSQGLKVRRVTLLGSRILLNGDYKREKRLLWRTQWPNEQCPNEQRLFLPSLFHMVGNQSCVMCPHSSLHMSLSLSAYILMLECINPFASVHMSLWLSAYILIHISLWRTWNSENEKWCYYA